MNQRQENKRIDLLVEAVNLRNRANDIIDRADELFVGAEALGETDQEKADILYLEVRTLYGEAQLLKEQSHQVLKQYQRLKSKTAGIPWRVRLISFIRSL